MSIEPFSDFFKIAENPINNNNGIICKIWNETQYDNFIQIIGNLNIPIKGKWCKDGLMIKCKKEHRPILEIVKSAI